MALKMILNTVRKMLRDIGRSCLKIYRFKTIRSFAKSKTWLIISSKNFLTTGTTIASKWRTP